MTSIVMTPSASPSGAPARFPLVAKARGLSARLPKRRTLLAVVLGLLTLLIFDRGVAPAMARYQQRHRVDDFLHARPTIRTGDSFAVLQIAAINLDKVVAEGDSRGILRGGPGHVGSSPAPGEPGNVIMVGRSSRFGGDFGEIGTLKAGAPIVVQLRGAAEPVRYVVEDVATIKAGSPLPASAAVESLTLVTSSGGMLSSSRTVVVAARDGAAKVDPTNTAPAHLPSSAPTSGDGVGLVVWGGAAVAMVVLARRVRVVSARITPSVLVAIIPIAATVAFKFALALDALIPATY